MIPLAEVASLVNQSVDLIRTTPEPDEDDLLQLAVFAAGIAVAAIEHAEQLGIHRDCLLAGLDAHRAISRAMN